MVFIVLFVFMLVFPGHIYAQNLSPQQIMNLAIDQLREDEQLKKGLVYEKRYLEEDIEYKNGKLSVKKKVNEELYEVYEDQGTWLEKLKEKNGKPVSAQDKLGPKMADQRPVIEEILGKPRYNYGFNGYSSIQEREVYSISFEPRRTEFQPEPEPGASIEAQVTNEILNNLSGIIYISTDNFSILRIEAHLTNRTPLRIKAVGKVYIFDTTLEKMDVGGITVNHKVEILGKGAKFNIFIMELGSQFKRVTIKYENYRLK